MFFSGLERIFLSLLFLLNTVLGYSLMLSAMSFNVWIFAGVVAGAGTGRWAFGDRNKTVMMGTKARKKKSSENQDYGTMASEAASVNAVVESAARYTKIRDFAC